MGKPASVFVGAAPPGDKVLAKFNFEFVMSSSGDSDVFGRVASMAAVTFAGIGWCFLLSDLPLIVSESSIVPAGVPVVPELVIIRGNSIIFFTISKVAVGSSFYLFRELGRRSRVILEVGGGGHIDLMWVKRIHPGFSLWVWIYYTVWFLLETIF